MLPKTLNGYLFYGLDSDAGQGYEMARKIGAENINMDLVKVYPQGVETVPHHGLAATASPATPPATINDTGASMSTVKANVSSMNVLLWAN